MSVEVISYRVEYPCRPDAVALVRQAVRRVMPECPVLDDVLTVASELSCNAVRHTRGARFWFHLELSDRDCLIQVEDEGPAPLILPTFDPVLGLLELEAVAGRGLGIVASLCKETGIGRSTVTGGLIVSGRVTW